MKRNVSITICILFLFTFIGCGDIKIINWHEYDTYGITNKSEKKDPDIEYRVIVGNVVWSIILFETIIAPIYFICFSLYEPVGVKDHSKPKEVL
jgi:hypothetical protein